MKPGTSFVHRVVYEEIRESLTNQVETNDTHSFLLRTDGLLYLIVYGLRPTIDRLKRPIFDNLYKEGLSILYDHIKK